MLRKVIFTAIPTVFLLWKPIAAVLDGVGLVDTVRGMMSPEHWTYKLIFWPHLGNVMTGAGFFLLVLIFSQRRQLFGRPDIHVHDLVSTATIDGRLLKSRAI